jgi:hypothetical protein
VPVIEDHFYDALQGWGTVLAALVALGVALWGVWARIRDNEHARKDAQSAFIVERLLVLSDLAHEWTNDRSPGFPARRERIRSRLLLVPEKYAVLLRRQVQMGNRPLVEQRIDAVIREMAGRNPDEIQPHQYKAEWIQAEISNNIAEELGLPWRSQLPLDGHDDVAGVPTGR